MVVWVFRLVVPRRDLGRVEWFLEEARARGFRLVGENVSKLFENRGDLDVFEYVFEAELSGGERRELEERLALSLHGCLGFFVVFRRRIEPG